jgi:hypothetical protein
MLRTLSLRLNALGLLAIVGVLAFAFVDQVIHGDLPCPLCLLQRAGFVLAGFGLALNLACGPRASHYGVVILGAAAGGAVALRQVLLHIVPGTGTYGEPFLGLHFYSWAALLFGLIIVGTAVLLLFDGGFSRSDDRPGGQSPGPGRLGLLALVLFTLMVLANILSTALECGIGLCPDNPTNYEWLAPSPRTP